MRVTERWTVVNGEDSSRDNSGERKQPRSCLTDGRDISSSVSTAAESVAPSARAAAAPAPWRSLLDAVDSVPGSRRRFLDAVGRVGVVPLPWPGTTPSVSSSDVEQFGASPRLPDASERQRQSYSSSRIIYFISNFSRLFFSSAILLSGVIRVINFPRTVF